MTKSTDKKIIDISTINYSEQMRQDYLDYAISVIMGRAIPDIRDGLKPVHRRIFYAMNQLHLDNSKPHRKSARIVGDVLGKYHPHGDSSVYQAMVNMAQPFKMNLPLVDGHGNFGSVDGDSAAAMRYTEARMGLFTHKMLEDIDKGLVNFKDNFDKTDKEPEVLPAKIPNLLINGISGIAVGVATDIPSHNPVETLDAIIRFLEKKTIKTEELLTIMQGPDFPSGGEVSNREDLLNIYKTGLGKFKVRGVCEVEDVGYGRKNVVITEIPQTCAGNLERLKSKIVDLAEKGQLPELVYFNDESDMKGIRIVLEVKKGTDTDKFINKLYKKTPLEETMSANFIAIVDGQPKVVNLKDMIVHFVEFQKEIYFKKYSKRLGVLKEKEEINEGFIKSYDVIDTIISVIRGGKSKSDVINCMQTGDTSNISFKLKGDEKTASKFNFTERQTKAILDMRLEQLLSIEVNNIEKTLEKIKEEIREIENILADENLLIKEIKKYLKETKKEFIKKLPNQGSRRTKITNNFYDKDMDFTVDVEEEEVLVLIDKFGYLKVVDTNSYNRSADETKSKYKHVIETTNLSTLCFFSEDGYRYALSISSLPKCKMKDKGTLISTLLEGLSEAEILFIIDENELTQKDYLLLVTKNGYLKKTETKEFLSRNKKIVITKFKEGDSLAFVDVSGKESYTIRDITSNGKHLDEIELTEVDFLQQGKFSKGKRIKNK